jgi:hypothetical protein
MAESSTMLRGVVAWVRHRTCGTGVTTQDDVLAEHHPVHAGALPLHGEVDQATQVPLVDERLVLGEHHQQTHGT